jgi:hypothetical protein
MTARWQVSVTLPIEADSAAEAASGFWAYVRELGAAQLPTYVSPFGDELAMRAYLESEPTNLDPEEDED